MPKNKANAAGLIFDSSIHYLDHLGPFCAELRWPLFFIDPIIKEMAERFYPDLDARLLSLDAFQDFQKTLSFLVTCAPRPLLSASLGPVSCKTLWLPHGNSDKGQINPYFQALQKEEIILVYGDRMAGFFRAGGVTASLLRIGCYRYAYYQKHRAFYDAFLSQYLKNLSLKGEDSSSAKDGRSSAPEKIDSSANPPLEGLGLRSSEPFTKNSALSSMRQPGKTARITVFFGTLFRPSLKNCPHPSIFSLNSIPTLSSGTRQESRD